MTSDKVLLVVPTFREADNIKALVDRVNSVRRGMDVPLDLLFVDDESGDGTRDIVHEIAREPGNAWVHILSRERRDGLSAAVLAGFAHMEADVLVAMDADLSHPPEAIPSMVNLVLHGDREGPIGMALGSRYVAGGATSEEWGLLNRVNSWIATSLARSFSNVSDPMSGFFAIRRDVLDRAPVLRPLGYKIALELMVRCPVGRVVEVPIHFSKRLAGKSKTTMKQRLLYLKHLRRLALFRYPERWMLFHFAVVGTIGAVANLALLTLLDGIGVPLSWAVPASVGSAMLLNFFLNRRFSFPDGRQVPILRPLLRFIAACSFGMLVNVVVTLAIVRAFPYLWIQAAGAVGILSGLGSNYILSRGLVFPTIESESR